MLVLMKDRKSNVISISIDKVEGTAKLLDPFNAIEILILANIVIYQKIDTATKVI